MRRMIATALACVALAGCSGETDEPLTGYVEGTFVNLAAETSGRLITRPLRAGGRVTAGDLAFMLDDVDQREALTAMQARLAQAQAELANLTTGQRKEEISVLAAELESARTNYTHAEDDLRRKLTLRERGIVADAAVDDARAVRDAADAAVEAAERRLMVARLPARPEVVAAAENNVIAMEADVARARHALDLRTIRAPVDAYVENTYFEVGELVAAGRTVATLLPDGARKIRFFVPEPELARLGIGGTVGLDCDGCADGLSAEINFIASEAEFTPPVIFSQDSRDKLVFLVEAVPRGAAADLKVGQPVDVTLPRNSGN